MALAVTGREGSDEVLVGHVSGCPRCTNRLSAFEQVLSDDRLELTAEADRAFGAARLDRQRANVLRRIGGSRSVARILAFPAQGPTVATPRRRVIRRSVAAAAVAGLLIGAAAGRLADSQRDFFQQAAEPGPRPDTLTGSLQVSGADEAFLEDFEAALGSPRVEPLLALDELTPPAAEDLFFR
jgi:hypothetical protein